MLADKVMALTPSMTLGISTKVKKLKGDGIDVINLSIGEPDFFTPEGAKQGGINAINANLTKYDAASGVLELRQAICEKFKNDNGLDYTPEQIVVSSGAKCSITNALMTITNPGDEVIIPSPFWVSYPEMVKLTGGTPVRVDTQFKNNFKITETELLNSISDKTKAIFITNPSNPTGAVYSKDELLAIANICVKQGIYIIADEIYERICYLDEFTSVASLSEAIKAQTIVINGMSKSLSMTGWRIGFTASTTEIAKAMAAIQGHLVSHPSTISQYAALAGLNDSRADIAQMRDVYKQRRDMVMTLIDDIDKLSIVQPDGAFYIFININALRPYVNADSLSLDVCNALLDDYRVAFVPGIAFGNDDFIRMSYAASDDNIKEGLRRLKDYIAQLVG